MPRSRPLTAVSVRGGRFATNAEMPSHPIARRLEVLAAQWANFTSNPEARLVRWQCRPDEVPVGAGRAEETRRGSTLGYLGESMLRMTHSSSHSAYREAVRKHMEKLIGPGWLEARAR
jgi:hypothetical protein